MSNYKSNPRNHVLATKVDDDTKAFVDAVVAGKKQRGMKFTSCLFLESCILRVKKQLEDAGQTFWRDDNRVTSSENRVTNGEKT